MIGDDYISEGPQGRSTEETARIGWSSCSSHCTAVQKLTTEDTMAHDDHDPTKRKCLHREKLTFALRV